MRHPLHDAGMWGLMAALGLLAIGWCAGADWLAAVGLFLAVAAWVLTWVAARHIPRASVTFGDLRTFRDLALVLAAAGG